MRQSNGRGSPPPADEGGGSRGKLYRSRSNSLPEGGGAASTVPAASPIACRGGGRQNCRGRFFDFQDIGARGDLSQIVEQIQVICPFPGTCGEFDKRGLFAMVQDRWYPENGIGLTRLGVVCAHGG